MNDHVAKPFRKAELLEKVSACLYRSRSFTESTVPAPEDTSSEDSELMMKLLGPEKVISMTSELHRRIEAAFVTPPTEFNRLELAQRAHDLISLSSMLGYSTLSKACIGLEAVCRNGAPFNAAFDAAQKAASSATKLNTYSKT